MTGFPDAMLRTLRGVKPAMQPGRWSACCPVHGDTHPSMRIVLGDTGVLLLRCYVCPQRGRDYLACVCRATGTQPWEWCRDGKPADAQRRERVMAKIIRTHNYCNAHGELILQECRLDGPVHTNIRRPATANDAADRVVVDHETNERWVWERPLEDAGFNLRGLLYNLPDLLNAPDPLVFITEGPRDADTLMALGLDNVVAVTNPFGAGEWHAEHAQHLRGYRCIVFEDNDPAGWKRTPWVVGTLVCAGAAKVGVVNFFDPTFKLFAKGFDVTDWLTQPAMLTAGVDAQRQAVIDRITSSVTVWEPRRAA